MVFDVEGINQLNKRQELEEYAYKQAISLALCTETQHPHSSEEGGLEKITPEGGQSRGNYKWYFSSGKDPSAVEKVEKAKRQGKRCKKEDYEKAREYAGVAVMVGKDLWKTIETMEPLGSRFMRIRLKTKQKVDIIVAYGPQAEKSPEEKDEFYDNLQKAIKATPKSHILIIAGDFNAKLMKPNSDMERTVIGTEAIYHEECEKGMGNGTRDNRF